MSLYERAGLVVAGDERVKLADNAYLNIGAGAAHDDPNAYDVRAYWDGTNLLIVPYTDDYLIELADSAATH